MKSIYLIGSLKNENVPIIGIDLRKLGYEVFDDWYSPGPEADDFWRKYEKQKGISYDKALKGYAAKHIFEFDKFHLDRCDIAILIMPAGKSCHLELGYMIGKGKRCFVLFDQEPERWDVMYIFAEAVFTNLRDLTEYLKTPIRNTRIN